MSIGHLTIEDAAQKAAGNWQDFTCFVWWREKEIPDSENWAIIYTHNRDSGLIDQSNAEVIGKALKPFTEGSDPDVVFESHSHWLVGHVDGFSIRVFRDGQITEAFEQVPRPWRRNWMIIRFSTSRITQIGNTKRPSKTSTSRRGS